VTEPQNDLEEALVQAATDPGSRPIFYKKLLESEIIVLGFSNASGEGSRTAVEGEKLSIVNWEKSDGTKVIPFFTSISAVQKILEEETRVVSLPARNFFEMTKGSTVYLNPKLDFGKEFFPHEIEALLETGVNHSLTQRIVEESTQIQLWQSAGYPTEMVSALTSLLSRHPVVKAAYLCMMQELTTDKVPTLLVGFEGEGSLELVMQEAGSVVADTAPRGMLVDFVEVTRENSGASGYMFESVEPFYRRSWGAKLWNLLRPGYA